MLGCDNRAKIFVPFFRRLIESLEEFMEIDMNNGQLVFPSWSNCYLGSVYMSIFVDPRTLIVVFLRLNVVFWACWCVWVC